VLAPARRCALAGRQSRARARWQAGQPSRPVRHRTALPAPALTGARTCAKPPNDGCSSAGGAALNTRVRRRRRPRSASARASRPRTAAAAARRSARSSRSASRWRCPSASARCSAPAACRPRRRATSSSWTGAPPARAGPSGGGGPGRCAPPGRAYRCLVPGLVAEGQRPGCVGKTER